MFDGDPPGILEIAFVTPELGLSGLAPTDLVYESEGLNPFFQDRSNSNVRMRDPPSALMDDLERITIRVEYICRIVSRIVFK